MNRQEMINELAVKKHTTTYNKYQQAIDYLKSYGKAINFNSVSQISGLSKTTLYNNAEIRIEIESYRDNVPTSASKARRKAELSDANSKAIIDSLKRKIISLQEENKELKRQLEVAYSSYYNSK